MHHSQSLCIDCFFRFFTNCITGMWQWGRSWTLPIYFIFTVTTTSVGWNIYLLNTISIVLECKYSYRLNQPKQQRLQSLISLSKAFHHWLRREEIKFTWLTVQPWIYVLIPHCGPGHFVCCNWKNMKVTSYNIWSPLAIPLENLNSSNFHFKFSPGRIKQKKSHWGWGMIN